MTFEELKEEAERQGYYLSKKQERLVKLLPCSCGRKRPSIIRNGCRKYNARCGCGKETGWITSTFKTSKEIQNEVRAKWNDIACK